MPFQSISAANTLSGYGGLLFISGGRNVRARVAVLFCLEENLRDNIKTQHTVDNSVQNYKNMVNIWRISDMLLDFI